MRRYFWHVFVWKRRAEIKGIPNSQNLTVEMIVITLFF